VVVVVLLDIAVQVCGVVVVVDVIVDVVIAVLVDVTLGVVNVYLHGMLSPSPAQGFLLSSRQLSLDSVSLFPGVFTRVFARQ
jgi:hypothetical protein